jgi:hypothetical protein
MNARSKVAAGVAGPRSLRDRLEPTHERDVAAHGVDVVADHDHLSTLEAKIADPLA